MGTREDAAKAKALLDAAGVDPEHSTNILGDPATVQLVLDGGPQFASMMAAQFPAESKTLYGQISATFDTTLGQIPSGMAGTMGAFSYVAPTKGHEINAEGIVRYNNGVFYDPNSDQVVFDHTNPEAQGSLAWFEKVQDSWNAKQIESWRKRLNKFGYAVSESGKWDQTFKAALTDFFINKYKNLGKPLPTDQAAGLTKADFGGTLDPAVLRNEVRGWYETAFGDDPTDAELEYWSDKLERSAKRIAHKQGLDPGAAVNVAHARQQEAFRQSPDVVAQREVDEDLEENQTLRNKFISLAQIAGM